MKDYLIAPSILSADFARLGQECRQVIEAGADMIHFDVMDNHFVPNLSFGAMVCRALREHGIEAPIDVHLMTSPVENLIRDFAAAGANYITIHPEAEVHTDRALSLIRELGCKAGVALNPATSTESLDYLWQRIDMVLLMSVNPGFGGQSFIPGVLDKIARVRQTIDRNAYDVRLEVDGGVNADNLATIASHGADTFVAGSAIFGQLDSSQPNPYSKRIKHFRQLLTEV